MSDRKNWRNRPNDTGKLPEQFDARRPAKPAKPAIDWSMPWHEETPTSTPNAAPNVVIESEVSAPFDVRRSRPEYQSLASLYSKPTLSTGEPQLDSIQRSFESGSFPVVRRADAEPAPPRFAEGSDASEVEEPGDARAGKSKSKRLRSDVTKRLSNEDTMGFAESKARSTKGGKGPRDEDDSERLNEGEVVGKYKIKERLSKGGMGAVYLAEHTLLGRKAALKVLLSRFSSSDEFVDRFFHEAKAITSIEHPGIVQVFDFGYHKDGNAYIVMELLQGESLHQRVARLGKLPIGQSLRIVRDVADALGAAHQRGIIHRDLKPGNVFLVNDDRAEDGYRIKLLDFGLAKSADGDDASAHQTSVGALMGTPAYMSPEQCRGAGAGRIDKRTDLYSLGCVLFRLLCGRPPFIAEAQGDVMSSHLRDAPPAPSEILPVLPPEVDALVLRALEKDPDRRFGSTEELIEQLRRLEEIYRTGPFRVISAVDAEREETARGPRNSAVEAEAPETVREDEPPAALVADGRAGSARPMWMTAALVFVVLTALSAVIIALLR